MTHVRIAANRDTRIFLYGGDRISCASRAREMQCGIEKVQ